MSLFNPFRDAIVSTAWNGTIPDVSDIHADCFDLCLKGLERVRQTQHSAAILLHGSPGAGKTHLLRRLRQQLASSQPVSTDRSHCLFVWVRLQTNPRAIWRHLRRRLVEDWFRPFGQAKTQFERVLYQRLAEVRPAEGDLERWIEYMRQEDPAGLEAAMDEIADNVHLDRNTAVAFKHIAFDRHRRDLRAWLCGDALPEAALERLDFALEEGTEEDREQQARTVVLMLCQLAGPHLPIALCFDQVEALQISAEDREGLYAFGQLVSTVHDESRNVLAISCVQTSYAEDLRTKSRGADYDRMRSAGTRALEPLTRMQAESLIRARLSAVEHHGTWPQSGTWPLESDELERLAEFGDLTPRRLLTTCADRFDAWVAGITADVGSPTQTEATGETTTPAPAPLPARLPVKEFLSQDWEKRREKVAPQNVPELTESLVRDALPLLLQVVAPDMQVHRDTRLPDVELLFASPRGKTGISLCTHSNMTSLGAKFKRLREQWKSGRLDRLLVLRDLRSPISPTAKKCRENLEELLQSGATRCDATVEALIALDVLRGLMGDAKSGDLANGPDTISPTSVEQWLRQHLPGELAELTEQVLPSAPAATSGANQHHQLLEALSHLLSDQPVLDVTDAALELSTSVEVLHTVITQHPQQFRLLAGPPAVVYRSN